MRATVILLLAMTAPVLADDATPLFNGRDLSNFDIGYSSRPADNKPASSLFEVRDGEVHTYPGIAAGATVPSGYFQTRDSHADFVLHLEYKWDGRKFAPRMQRLRDAGIMFHIYEEVPQSWPHGVEAQIEEKDVGDLWLISAEAGVPVLGEPRPITDPLQDSASAYAPVGNPATFGGHMKYVRVRHNADYEKPGWNSVDVVVRGDSAIYLVNGQANMRVVHMKKWVGDHWEKLDRGKILFQAEYAGISYRNITIRPVTEKDPK
jgi:hypothetical protein